MTPNYLRSCFWAFLWALALGCTFLAVPSVPSQSRTLYMNSSGQPIPTIFWQLRPNSRFAQSLWAQRAQESKTHLQNLVLNKDCPRAFVKVYGCNGQYMVPERFRCNGSRCGTGSYLVYYDEGSEDCHGYFVPAGSQGYCNGCELGETFCDPC